MVTSTRSVGVRFLVALGVVACLATSSRAAGDQDNRPPEQTQSYFGTIKLAEHELTEAMVKRPRPGELDIKVPRTSRVYVDHYVKVNHETGKRYRGSPRAGYTYKHGDLGPVLDGFSATLFEDGSLKGLASYKSSLRDGKMQVWDEDAHPAYYGEYIKGKKSGIVCWFAGGSPLLMQECDNGEITASYLVKYSEHRPTAVREDKLSPEEKEELKRAADELATFESSVVASEKRVKNILEDRFKRRRALIAREKYDAAARRSAALQESNDAAIGAGWNSALQR